jgi:hypothetical protein
MMTENTAYWFRALALWFVLMAAETLHGLWRVKVLAVWIGDDAARDVSVFTGSLVIALITWACIGVDPGTQCTNAVARRVHMGRFDDRFRTSFGPARLRSNLGRHCLGL